MRRVVELGRYSSVAVQSALSDWAVFALIFGLTGHELAAQAVARLVGGATSFALNKLWAFEAGGTGRLAREARRFLALLAFSYALSLGLLAAMSGAGLTPWLAKPTADLLCFLVNFAVMKVWVFDTSQAEAEPLEQ